MTTTPLLLAWVPSAATVSILVFGSHVEKLQLDPNAEAQSFVLASTTQVPDRYSHPANSHYGYVRVEFRSAMSATSRHVLCVSAGFMFTGNSTRSLPRLDVD